MKRCKNCNCWYGYCSHPMNYSGSNGINSFDCVETKSHWLKRIKGKNGWRTDNDNIRSSGSYFFLIILLMILLFIFIK